MKENKIDFYKTDRPNLRYMSTASIADETMAIDTQN